MQYKKYPGIDSAGQDKFNWRNVTIFTFQGRRMESVLEGWNSTEDAFVTSIRNHTCGLWARAKDALHWLRRIKVDYEDLWWKYQKQIFRPSGSQREATPCVAVSDNKDHVGGYAVARWPFLTLFLFFHFSNRPIFAGLESKFGLIFPKTALINNLDGHWVYIFVCKQLLYYKQ